MKALWNLSVIIMVFIVLPVMAHAQTSGVPPLSQPLVREGTLASDLVAALNIGTPASEAEAESALSDVGIAPRNGWIADYPVTPDIVGELQTSINEAASGGRISMDNNAALKAFQDIMFGYNLSVAADVSGAGGGETSAPNYPDSESVNDYYYEEGPPVVTYYSPPPDYAYLYSWVPYPFWCLGFSFTGFFVLSDFHVRRHRHGHDEFITNHFHDFRTGRVIRIDAASRAQGRTFSSSTAGGAQSGVPSATANSGRSCSSCHYSVPSAGGRSSGFSGRGLSGGGGRGSFGSLSGGSPGGGWRR
ncbi:MAG TPA: hypothetical protein VEI96_04490 [Thermodesulfovibrionales bacterium]|nr:hypothetical protein [Thermodesulfovibrionales bacterium]